MSIVKLKEIHALPPHPTLITERRQHQTQAGEAALWEALEKEAEEDDENPDNGDYNAS